MNTTIRADIPIEMKRQIDSVIASGKFASVNAVVQHALTAVLPKPKRSRLTVNGFTPEFEEEVLASSRSPSENDTVIETEEDLERYFDRITKEVDKERHAHQNKR